MEWSLTFASKAGIPTGVVNVCSRANSDIVGIRWPVLQTDKEIGETYPVVATDKETVETYPVAATDKENGETLSMRSCEGRADVRLQGSRMDAAIPT